MMVEHTPGPWTVHWDKGGGGFHIEDSAGEGVIGLGSRTLGSKGILGLPADARLIAAAPDLLEALEGLLEYRGEALPPVLATEEEGSFWAAARSALAQARGEKP